MSDDCFDKIRELIDQAVLGNDRLKFFLKEIDELKYDANGKMDPENFKAKFADYLKDFNEKTISGKLQKALNIEKRKMNEVIGSQYKNKPGEWLRSLTTWTFDNMFGGESGADIRHHANKGAVFAFADNALKEQGVDKIFESGMFQREAAQAVTLLENGKALPKDFPEDAAKIAKIIIKTNAILHDQMRDAGLIVGKQVGYIAPQSHDIEKIKAAGFEQWYNDIRDKLDVKKTFDKIQISDKEMRIALQETYNKITSGLSEESKLGQVSDKLINFSVSEIDAQYKRSRSLFFKDGGDFYDYNKSYGVSDMYESFLRNIDKTTRTAALVSKFGSNPEQGLEGLIARAKLDNKGNEKALDNLNNNLNAIRNEFRDIRGYGSRPGNDTIAQAAYAARNVQSLALLSNLSVNSMISPINMFSYLRARNGMSIVDAASTLLDSYVKNFSRADRIQYSKLFHIYVGDGIDHMGVRMSEEGGTWLSGGMSKVSQKMFRWTGVYDQTQILRLGSVRALTVDAADLAGKAYGELNTRFQSSLSKAGISSKDWDFIRKSAKEEFDGATHVTPEGLLNMDNDQARQLMVRNNIKGFASVDAYKRYTAILWTDYLTKASEISSHISGARQNAALFQGHSAGEAVGAALRVGTQFMQYPLKQVDLMRKIAAANNEYGGAESLRTTDYKMVASTVAFLTMGGLVVNRAKDLATGHKAREPDEELSRAFVRGGAGGLYSDMLLHDYSDHPEELVYRFIGPTFSQLPTLAKSMSDAVNGDTGHAAKGLLDTIIRNTPMQNFILNKRIFDGHVQKEMQNLISDMTGE